MNDKLKDFTDCTVNQQVTVTKTTTVSISDSDIERLIKQKVCESLGITEQVVKVELEWDVRQNTFMGCEVKITSTSTSQ